MKRVPPVCHAPKLIEQRWQGVRTHGRLDTLAKPPQFPIDVFSFRCTRLGVDYFRFRGKFVGGTLHGVVEHLGI
jgi:hypothetical protein